MPRSPSRGPGDGGSGLVVAAAAFACATAFNSVVAVRENVPGEPLGIGVPISVRRGILVGWGSAVAAPWPMPVAALAAATRSRDVGLRRAATICMGLGAAGVLGILIEPNTYRARTWTAPTRTAVVAHVVTCAALVTAGAVCLSGARRAEV